jgi:asparagine synthase (glutamine-hydrolysing)
MCGIFAVIFKDRTNCNIDYEISHQLLSVRGPDSQTYQVDSQRILGFTRLSINDISEDGNQPMKTTNTHLMCNGEIFNYKQLMEKYSIDCKSKSDCEVLLHLYEKDAFFPREFNGDFAVFIEDMKRNRVVLSRDRVGVRPLFYGFAKNSGDFVVASEMKCLSMCENIQHVVPGSIVYFDKTTRQITIEKYYEVTSILTVSKPVHFLKDILIESTKRRLLSDRPIGCLLSGGLDSSVITSILCKLLGPKNVRTYSIGMEGSLDLSYARKVANFLGTNHTEVIFTAEEGLTAIPDVIYALESYDITTVRASVGMFLLGKYISKHTNDKVIFSGEGSDELLCGYLYFHYAPSGGEAHKESLRLISDLYKYDVLRADRCISPHGLELRVPFLDKDFMNFCTSLHGELKQPRDGMEKRILREQFIGELPDEVLWRRKDGFSDGVSSKTKLWYEYIEEYAEKQVSEKPSGMTKEAYYYKSIYDKFFPHYPKPIDYYWMPKWINSSNPSGRTLEVFQS